MARSSQRLVVDEECFAGGVDELGMRMSSLLNV
jgi:hypothetical protein